MKKTFLTEEQITNFVKRGNSILTSSDFKKLHLIAAKYKFTLTSSKQSNIQMWWNAISEKMNQLSPSDSFRIHYEQGLRVWQYRNVDNAIITAYMKHLKIYDSEYMLLASPKLDEIYTYVVCELGGAGVDTTGGAGIFINNSGDYYGYISKYGRKYCDPVALKASDKLMNTLESMSKDLTAAEKHNLSSVIQQYLTSSTPIESDTFHNLLYKGQ